MKARRGISFLEYALLAALVGIVGAVGVMKYGKQLLLGARRQDGRGDAQDEVALGRFQNVAGRSENKKGKNK